MKNKLLIVFVFSLQLLAGQVYRTQSFLESVKSLKVNIWGERLSLPVIELGGDRKIQVSFDELSHNARNYSYKVIHCNADWTTSSLNSNEYITGFITGNVTDYKYSSVITTFPYIHYSVVVPSEDMNLKLSGNYVLLIYEDNLPDNPIVQACFSIVEPRTTIAGRVRGNTDLELSNRLQQLDFDVNLTGYLVNDPNAELKVVVRQNNRIDNQVENIQPSYFTTNKLSYVNNKDLIFEGGNEYHRFDISSIYVGGQGVDKIRFDRPYYHAFLFPNKIIPPATYTLDNDINGKYIVNVQKSSDVDTDADYMYVHFFLPLDKPFFDGMLYLGGEFNQNQLNAENRLKYDGELNGYTQTLLLKQGGYNYQYWFVRKGASKASTERVDGSYWQTLNEYSIYIYHRPWGERYDKLIGFKTISN